MKSPIGRLYPVSYSDLSRIVGKARVHTLILDTAVSIALSVLMVVALLSGQTAPAIAIMIGLAATLLLSAKTYAFIQAAIYASGLTSPKAIASSFDDEDEEEDSDYDDEDEDDDEEDE